MAFQRAGGSWHSWWNWDACQMEIKLNPPSCCLQVSVCSRDVNKKMNIFIILGKKEGLLGVTRALFDFFSVRHMYAKKHCKPS